MLYQVNNQTYVYLTTVTASTGTPFTLVLIWLHQPATPVLIALTLPSLLRLARYSQVKASKCCTLLNFYSGSSFCNDILCFFNAS
jgi:hypothetical protein